MRLRWLVSVAVVLGIAALSWGTLRGGRNRGAAAPTIEAHEPVGGVGESLSALQLVEAPQADGRVPVAGQGAPMSRSGASQGGEILVTGRVRHTDPNADPSASSPAAGFVMTVDVSTPAKPWEARSMQVTTGPDGTFVATFADLPTRPLLVRFTSPSDGRFEAMHEEAVIEAGRSLDVDLRRVQCARLEGRTVDANGKPMPGVALTFVTKLWSFQELETVSDDNGLFSIASFSQAFPSGWLEADHPTHQLLRWTVPELDARGWAPIEVVLAPRSKLVVRVLDRQGLPLPGRRVDLSAAPIDALGRTGSARAFDPSYVLTNASGVASFSEIPAGQRLQVVVSSSSGKKEATRMRGGELVFGHSPAEPLVVEPGKTLALTARLTAATVSGRVVLPTGEPVPAPDVRVRSVSELASRSGWIAVRGGADGSFSVPLVLEDASAVHLLATDGEQRRGNQPCSITLAGTAMLSVEELERGDEVILTLRPTSSITGSIADSDGVLLAVGEVYAVPAGSPIPGDSAPSPDGEPVSNGAFRVCGLDAGRYDLHVSFRHGLLPSRQVFAGIRAGEQDVRLTLEHAFPVELRVVTNLDPGSASAHVLLERRWPRPGNEPEETAPSQVHVSRPGWPEGQPSSPPKSWKQVDEGGVSDFTLAKLEDPAELALSLAEGWYTLGLAAGEGFAPMSTDRLWLGAGQRTIVFHPVPTAELAGTLQPARPDLALQLVDRGRPLPLPGESAPEAFSRIDTQGRFAFDAPVGEYTLRVGRDEDLLRGVFELEVPVSIHAGENAPLALVLR